MRDLQRLYCTVYTSTQSSTEQCHLSSAIVATMQQHFAETLQILWTHSEVLRGRLTQSYQNVVLLLTAVVIMDMFGFRERKATKNSMISETTKARILAINMLPLKSRAKDCHLRCSVIFLCNIPQPSRVRRRHRPASSMNAKSHQVPQRPSSL